MKISVNNLYFVFKKFTTFISLLLTGYLRFSPFARRGGGGGELVSVQISLPRLGLQGEPGRKKTRKRRRMCLHVPKREVYIVQIPMQQRSSRCGVRDWNARATPSRSAVAANQTS